MQDRFPPGIPEQSAKFLFSLRSNGIGRLCPVTSLLEGLQYDKPLSPQFLKRVIDRARENTRPLLALIDLEEELNLISRHRPLHQNPKYHQTCQHYGLQFCLVNNDYSSLN